MNPLIPNTPISVATQTDKNPPFSNVGQGRLRIDETKDSPLFEIETETPPHYRRNLSRVFGEDFLKEAALKDKTRQAIIKFVKARKWEELKQFSKHYFS